MKRVKVVVMPADATVEVEGAKVDSKGGIFEITGAPGTVRKVHIFKGKSETTTDVVVTEAGALPPKVELAVGGGGGAPKPAATGAATAKPASKGIMTEFN
jgi:serine/threonine-protein kinase